MRGFTIIELMIVVAILAISVFSFRGACANESQAINALESSGFSEIEIQDHDYMFVGFRGCSSSDAAKFSVSAKNPIGNKVSVYVCVGWPFKGATVRTN